MTLAENRVQAIVLKSMEAVTKACLSGEPGLHWHFLVPRNEQYSGHIKKKKFKVKAMPYAKLEPVSYIQRIL